MPKNFIYAPHADLAAEIAENIKIGVTSIAFTPEGSLRVALASEPDTFQKEMMDEILVCRGFLPSVKGVILRGSRGLVDLEIAIVEDQAWQLLGGIVTNSSFIVPDVDRVMGRITGSFRANKTGAQLQFTETNDAGNEVVMGSWNMPDTADAWTMNDFDTTTPPRIGRMTYKLEGRLNGATSASLRFVTAALLEILV